MCVFCFILFSFFIHVCLILFHSCLFVFHSCLFVFTFIISKSAKTQSSLLEIKRKSPLNELCTLKRIKRIEIRKIKRKKKEEKEVNKERERNE